MGQIQSILRPPAGTASAGSSQLFHQTLFGVFLISFAVVELETVRVLPALAESGWPGVFLIATALATTMASLARQLPAQNVLLASVIIALIAGTVQAIGALTGIPFGPYFFTETAGPKILNVLPICIPAVWIIAIFNARGVARLVLRPWRKSRLYGFRLIGLTATLTVAFDFEFEPYATRVKNFWAWQPTKLPMLWHGTPPSNFLGWLVTTLLILAFVTPVLINKSHKKFPSDYHPLIVWLLLSVLFASGLMMHQLWLAGSFTVAVAVVVSAFAVRGARW